MKFSIITVVKDDEKNILNTIKSVKKQTFKDFEHIIFDGNSTDETKNTVRKNMNSKIRLFSRKDSGMYDAINKSINLSRGEYIFLLHSGDLIISKNFLALANNVLKSKKCHSLSGNVLYYKSQKKIHIISRKWRCPILKSEKFFFLKVPHTSLIIKKDFQKKIGKYDLSYKISSDTDMLTRIGLSKNLNHEYIDKYFIYMKHGGLSTSMKHLKKKFFEDIVILYKYFKYKFLFIYIYKIFIKLPGLIFKKN